MSGLTAAFLLGSMSLVLNAQPGAAQAPATRAVAAYAARPLVGAAVVGETSHFGHMATIDVGRLPTSVAVDQRTGTVWVVNSLDGTVSEISESRRAVIATIKVAASPVDIAADPKTGTVWVTCLGPFGKPASDNVVSEISEASGTVVATIKVGLVPFGIAADPRTGTVWVANTNGYSVSEISEARRTVVATVPTGMDSAPVSLAVDASRGIVWVAKLHHRVLEVSEATRAVIAAIRVRPGGGPYSLNAVTVDQATAVAWVASDFYDGTGYFSYATAVGTASREVLAKVPVPKAYPYANIADGIAADPATGTVWVAQNGANTVTLISAGTDSVARNLPTGDQPVAVAADSVTGTVWIVNNYDATVTEYAYSRPTFTSAARISIASGSRVRFDVHATGFPIAVMTVSGMLPPGVRAGLRHGTVFLTGVPARSARGKTYHLAISADNGVGTPSGQYVATQDLAVRVT